MTTTDEPVVLRELRDGVLVLTMNRPAKLNAWNAELAGLFNDELAAADLADDVRAIVIAGAGRGFCSGADISAPVDPAALDGPRPGRRWDAFPPLMRTPVIAAVHGACIGMGFTLALQCDVRFVAQDARLSTAFTRRGLIAEHGSSTLLCDLVGRGRALDLLLSARTFSGADAGDYGLAQFVLMESEVLPAAVAYAQELAQQCSPTAMAAIKVQLDAHRTESHRDALEASDDLMWRSFGWPDAVEGGQAFRERRPPSFPPLDRSEATLPPPV